MLRSPSVTFKTIGVCNLFDNYQSNDTKNHAYKMKVGMVKRVLETAI